MRQAHSCRQRHNSCTFKPLYHLPGQLRHGMAFVTPSNVARASIAALSAGEANMVLEALGNIGFTTQESVLERALPALTHQLASCINLERGQAGTMEYAADGNRKSREFATKIQAYSDKMLNLVELMRAFSTGSSALQPARLSLLTLSRDLVGLVRCIARVNDTALSIEVADDCRNSELANPDLRLVLLVIVETLVRSNMNADKPLKVELNCGSCGKGALAMPDLPETWLNAQLHQAAQELLDAGGGIEVLPSPQATTARLFVPVKAASA
jgi:signal transduction histidine kinase